MSTVPQPLHCDILPATRPCSAPERQWVLANAAAVEDSGWAGDTRSTCTTSPPRSACSHPTPVSCQAAACWHPAPVLDASRRDRPDVRGHAVPHADSGGRVAPTRSAIRLGRPYPWRIQGVCVPASHFARGARSADRRHRVGVGERALGEFGATITFAGSGRCPRHGRNPRCWREALSCSTDRSTGSRRSGSEEGERHGRIHGQRRGRFYATLSLSRRAP